MSSFFVGAFQDSIDRSPSLLGHLQPIAANTKPNMMLAIPTIIYARPKKSFLPPIHDVVLSTTRFVPSKRYVLYWFWILTRRIVPAGMSLSMRPHNFRNFGSTALRIHTMKCSFSFRRPANRCKIIFRWLCTKGCVIMMRRRMAETAGKAACTLHGK